MKTLSLDKTFCILFLLQKADFNTGKFSRAISQGLITRSQCGYRASQLDNLNPNLETQRDGSVLPKGTWILQLYIKHWHWNALLPSWFSRWLFWDSYMDSEAHKGKKHITNEGCLSVVIRGRWIEWLNFAMSCFLSEFLSQRIQHSENCKSLHVELKRWFVSASLCAVVKHFVNFNIDRRNIFQVSTAGKYSKL